MMADIIIDISLAASKGIDAFALNIGRDSWESAQVSNAYTAAKSLNTTFKLFISFDMTSLPCASANDAVTIRNYTTSYASHPNQLKYNGSVFVSTFAGESCTFGAGNVNQGWTNTLKKNLTSTYFMPSFFVDPATFPDLTVMDGAFNVSDYCVSYLFFETHNDSFTSGTLAGPWVTTASTPNQTHCISPT